MKLIQWSGSIKIAFIFQFSLKSRYNYKGMDVSFNIVGWLLLLFNPIQDERGEGAKRPPALTSFSPVTSANVRLVPKTFWLLVLTLLTDWCKIPSLYLAPVPNYWTWTKTIPQKKQFFWSIPYKIEVMITYLIQILKLPSFSHMTICTI